MWFTEKGHDGASRLYALSDLSPRSDEAIGRRYLAGRYGATPILAAEEFAEVALHAASEPAESQVSPKRGGEPKRKVSDTAKRRSVLVFTEGKKTEPVYLMHWSRAYRERIIVTIDGFHGTPLSLVQEAAARRAADLKAARRGRGDAYSEYWCVFDIDEHPNVARALELAASSGVMVCVTNPCVELWFLLHFQEQNAAIHRHDAQRKAAAYLNDGKTPTSVSLAALPVGMRTRAAGLRNWTASTSLTAPRHGPTPAARCGGS